jgi:hypothetical protein
MEEIYRLAKPYKMIFGLLPIFVICYSTYLSSLGWGKESLISNAVPLIFAAISALFFINRIKSKVIISDVSFNLFSKKELPLKNIRVSGYMGDKY